MEVLLRYVRLYAHFVRFSFARAFEFRVDFFFRVFMDLVFYSVNIAFFKIIFLSVGEPGAASTGLLGGWREDEVIVFVAGYLFVDAFNMTVFANNMWWLPQSINRGDLDYYLVRPVSSLFFLTLRDFAANSFLNFLLTIGILVWAVAQYSGPITVGGSILFVVFLLNGALLYQLFRMLTVIPIFWLHSGRGFEQLFWSATRLMERPDGIFRGWLRRILFSVVPFSLMASLPTRGFLAGFSFEIVVHLLGATLVFGALVLWFWRKGMRAYSSASS